jgi:hypothetical protein
MRFKKTTRSLDFADPALANCLEQNRSIKLMEQLSSAINWSRVESILLSHYTVGTSEEGARAYPPLMLFKCLMLQKWFRIQSDPELENQITDRLSFKTFLGLSFSQPAPDHSTFSRFRARLPSCRALLGGNHPFASLIEVRPQVAKLLLQLRGCFHASKHIFPCYKYKVFLLTDTYPYKPQFSCALR